MRSRDVEEMREVENHRDTGVEEWGVEGG